MPPDFSFPFTPYDSQVRFTESLYDCAMSGNVGILESPTGTGKTMAIITGSLAFLHEVVQRDAESGKDEEKGDGCCGSAPAPSTSSSSSSTSSVPSWVNEQHQAAVEAAKVAVGAEVGEKLAKARTGLAKRLDAIRAGVTVVAARKGEKRTASEVEDEVLASLTLDAYYSDDEGADDADDVPAATDWGSRDQVQEVKVFYAARTHSQLSQFLKELTSSPLASASACPDETNLGTRTVTLASRDHFCINDSVSRGRSGSALSDACTELRNSSKGCGFAKREALGAASDILLSRVSDVEDVVRLGRRTYACPYFSTRRALPLAQVVTLPYPLILSASTRAASGISLAGNVVVLDEGHNVVEAIRSSHRVVLSGADIRAAHESVTRYLARYLQRLHVGNVKYLRQILSVLQLFRRVLDRPATPDEADAEGRRVDEQVLTPNQFLFAASADNLNLFKIERYFRVSEVCRKVQGFAAQVLREGNGDEVERHGESKKRPRPGVPPSTAPEGVAGASRWALNMVRSFLVSLNTTEADGRVLVRASPVVSEQRLEFILLNPEEHFRQLCREARAVILTGGTFHPVDAFVDRLLGPPAVTGPPDPLRTRLQTFSCDHVVPASSLLCVPLTAGPAGTSFSFTFANRSNSPMLKDLGRAIANLCAVVRGGVVVFFPSYSFEAEVWRRWSADGIVKTLEGRKPLFREQRAGSTPAPGPSLLDRYSAAVAADPRRGAILFAVVGGKLSEGINFSDDLARAVVVVGMPYPNANDVVREASEASALAKRPDLRSPADISAWKRARADDDCMRAVNQSIGRAIRHVKDHAVIVLADERYTKPRIQNLLPAWIRRSTIAEGAPFSRCIKETAQFVKRNASE
jgi:chromosome transmission fidelity protein 1